MHSSNFTNRVCPLRAVSKGLEQTHNIPTLRRILGQNRKLRKENKYSKNAIKKYLHRTIAEQTPTDNIYDMGNFPLDPDEIKVLNRGLSFVCAPEMVPKQKYGKPF